MNKNFEHIGKKGCLLFLLLTMPVSVLAALTFVPAEQPTGYVMQPALSRYDLSSGNEVSYQTTFDKDNGTGDLFAYPIAANAVVDSASEKWNGASEHIDLANWDSERWIVTYDGSSGIPFRLDDLTDTQKPLLGPPHLRQAVLDYLRGDYSNQTPNGFNFRYRETLLGEIIHSRPYLRDGIVYVGANDGMLHAFNATNSAASSAGFGGGDELWAYIPSMLLPKIKNLTTTPYARDYYVDGVVAFGFNTDFTQKILVGGLGAGGMGLYALDITNPVPTSESNAASRVLWEITPAMSGFANLGYTYSQASIAKVQFNESGTVVTRSVAIVGNGYLNSGNGHSTLYVIDLVSGALIKELDTGSGTLASPAGLSTPTTVDAYWSDPVELDEFGEIDASDETYFYANDGIVDFVFAGDIDGKLWKFDLTDKDPDNWTANLLYDAGQAITTAPAIVRHTEAYRYLPDGSGGEPTAFMVNFATGRIFTQAEADDSSTVYAAYGIWDGAPSVNTTLVAQTLTARTYGADTLVRTASSNAVDWTLNGDLGWRTPLPAGERVVGDGTFISAGRYYFTSSNPSTVNASPKPPRGSSWLLELDYLTGGGALYPFLDLSKDQHLDDYDRLTGYTGVASVPVAKYLGEGVYSQPQVVQLSLLNQTLFNFNPDVTIPPPPDDFVLTGGHFDFDIFYGYTNTGTGAAEAEKFCVEVKDKKCKKEKIGFCTEWKEKDNIDYCKKYTEVGDSGDFENTHTHMYDDIYDVTGVNMLNASNAKMNLSNAISDPTLGFKVIVANQRLNPAAKIAIGPGMIFNNVYDVTNGASLDVATLPSYDLTDITQLVIKLPVDGFSEKDWLGIGDVRAGLIPTETGCVNKSLGGDPGLNDEWHNGALTVQVIKDTIPNTAIQQNVSGDNTLGFRVTDAEIENYLIAEFTIFWHHKSLGACYGDANWSQTPGPDTSGDHKDPVEPAPGSQDPRDGDFTPPSGEILSIKTLTEDEVTTTTTKYVDGEEKVVTRTKNDDGTVTIRTVYTDSDGNVLIDNEITIPDADGTLAFGGEETGASATGRIFWRQLQN